MVALPLALLAVASVQSVCAVETEDVEFSFNYTTQNGFGVYVLGDLPELGGNDPTRSIRLIPTPTQTGPTWHGAIAIPSGTDFTYQFIRRNDTVSQWADPSNNTPLSSITTSGTMPAVPPPPCKGMYYYSSWQQPRLFWRIGTNGVYNEVAMQAFGLGRESGESRWRALGVGEGCRLIDFYFTDGGGSRDPAVGSYRTKLDAFLVQDGEIFEYQPAPTVSPWRRDYDPQDPPTITSFILSGEIRPYRVVLPRGYDEHTDRYYPVLYLQDGEQVFDPAPTSSWDAHLTAAQLTSGGKMREIIMVGVDATAGRIYNYIPQNDGGEAGFYWYFLRNELKVVIDGNYRTLQDPDNTASLGASLGGVISLYLGWTRNEDFGRCAAMSGSWTTIPTYLDTQVEAAQPPLPNLRFYLDSGDSGPSSDNAMQTRALRDIFMEKDWVLSRNLLHYVGYGQSHNITAWKSRLSRPLEFLFPVTEADNTLRHEIFRGDFDGDGDMDRDDYAILESCLSGPDQAESPSCPGGMDADLDDDGDVDMMDASVFSVYFTGALDCTN